MKKSSWMLENSIKTYDWGSFTRFNTLFNLPNPHHQPQAEIWMGAHPNDSSRLIINPHEKCDLYSVIKKYPNEMIGERVQTQFAGLPFLFKVLAAEKPLSIQVHPEKSKAKQGFDKENQLGIALNAPNRNYKDPNHKPELVYALTPFKAMNAFRPIDEIIALFNQLALPALQETITQLTQSPTPSQLKHTFKTLLTLAGEQKHQAITQLLTAIEPKSQVPFSTIKALAPLYPDDNGLFTPLLLNVIELQPGQAMFLYAQTPHAYLHGTALEIMANSDNVLRAGLTAKYIDVEELLDNTQFTSIAAEQLLTQPIISAQRIDFPVPVSDFKFEILTCQHNALQQKVTGPEILFCISGNLTITTACNSLTLVPGESLFMAYAAQAYRCEGEGQLARAYV